MPPLPRISTPALLRLAEQLRFAPREAIARDLERIEALAPEIDAQASYPEEWIVYRVTGFRADLPPAPPVSGAEILRDLSALAERLSMVTRDSIDREPPGLVTLPALAERWNVSPKTIERLRRRGLIARRVIDAQGKWRLAFSDPVITRFADAHPELISRAASFSRMDQATRERVLRCARLYRRAGLTLNQAADRTARRVGRSREAVRQILIAHDRRPSAAPIFGWRGPMRREDAARALSLAGQGVEPRHAASAMKRSASSVRRGISIARAARLRTLFPGSPAPESLTPSTAATRAPSRAAPAPSSPPSSGPDLRTRELTDPSAASGLGEPGITDLLELIRAARRREVPLGVVERARARAFRALLTGARAGTHALDEGFPSTDAIDTIETALRWAARLKAELVRSHLTLILETLEDRAGLRLDEQRAGPASELVTLAIHAACRAVDAFDPARGGRLAAPITLMVTRETARWLRDTPAPDADPPGRAAPRLASGIAVPDWTLEVAPWQEWLEPDPRVRAALHRASDEPRAAIALRMGWPEWIPRSNPPTPARPHTIAEVAERLGVSATAAARLERRAIREATGSDVAETKRRKGRTRT